MHGRMELNAVRHAMQIQDAPGDNAGKKLRLTRLYQPVLKGARIQPPPIPVPDAPIRVVVPCMCAHTQCTSAHSQWFEVTMEERETALCRSR